MTAMARVKHRWDTREYTWIEDVQHRNGHLTVSFRDGTQAVVDVADLLPPRYHVPDWEDLRFDEFEIVVPTATGDLEIPWSAIRVLTDPAFDAHLKAAAEREAQRVGRRVRELRESRGLSADELGSRVGLTAEQLGRLEAGQAGVPLETLGRLVEAMGYTIHEFVIANERA